jgi:tripartite-type tricarboxylate transporter receptor subunit TctC
MKLPRRRFLQLAAGGAALQATSRIAGAQTYPTRPVHIMVGFAAAGPTDIAARLLGQFLSERLGQQFVVENRPGAGSNLATELVVRAPPDGYTLLLVTSANAFNATLYDNLKFDFVRDSTPVAGIMRSNSAMEVTAAVPARTVSEFIAYARANPGKINMATGGNGSPPHVFGELFKSMAGVDLATVHYRGAGPALIDLLGGQVQVMFEDIAGSIEYLRAGKLRALAVTAATRSAALPDVPTIGETVAGYEASGFFGLAAPKHTPTEIVDRLNREINMGLSDDRTLNARLADLGAVPTPITPAQFGKLVTDETEKWSQVIRAANIKLN